MSEIEMVSTRSARYGYRTEDIAAIARKWLGEQSEEAERFSRFASSARIEQRYFARPLEEIVSLRGTEARARIFQEEGKALAEAVVRDQLQHAQLCPNQIGAIIFTSCSVPVIPALDTHLINALEFKPSIIRVPLFQYGCAAGAYGLALGNRLAASAGPTLLVSVELCSLIYQNADRTSANLVGSALFGDGAAAVLLRREHGSLEVIDTCSWLIPGSTDLMGYAILDDGMHLRLDRELPRCLSMTVPQVLHNFLAAHQLATEDIAWWLLHPGGVKVLKGLEETLALNLAQTRWSWEALRQFGNMSSASILFVLDLFLQERAWRGGDKALILGVGPGLTLELILVRCRE